MRMETEKVRDYLKRADLYTYMGRIDKIVGTTVEATGPECRIGDVCTIEVAGSSREMAAEVVGFRENKVLLMPYEDIEGIGYGSAVHNTGSKLLIPVADSLIGRTVDALGQPIDGGPPVEQPAFYPITGVSSNPMDRPRIDTAIQMGVKAIDGLLTIGKGQRMGIFAGSGVGKSTLMGMIAKNVKADVNVIALVGERSREVVEFINRDQGKDVLLMMDSLTRFAMAQREIGLSIGEPPVARGYTPSIYSELPRLLERSGNFEQGSITGIYTVLVEGDDANEPISDTVRGIIDGHIMLSRKVATSNRYPAIDILSSISRLMNEIVLPEHKEAAGRLRKMLSVYESNLDLVSIGAYKKGTNPELDEALERIRQIYDFLQQKTDESFTLEETVLQMIKLMQ